MGLIVKMSNQVKTLETRLLAFIKKANTKHNFKYSYEFVNYVNSHTKVTIICPIHGNFTQTPGSHLVGRSECFSEDVLQNTPLMYLLDGGYKC